MSPDAVALLESDEGPFSLRRRLERSRLDLRREEKCYEAADGSVIIGIGTDIIEIDRIERSVQRYGEAFLRRVYTEGEIAYCTARKNAAESFAARFAAKEAGAKALGTGISRGVSWREFDVRRRPGQRPEIHLTGRAAEVAHALGVKRLSLSLTHSRKEAMAVVIAES